MLLDFTNPRLPVGVRADKVFGSMNTPNSVASNMVNMTWENIKDDIDKDWVFLNVCCKTGVFPTNLFDKLVTCKNLVKAFPNYYERRHWILENMIKCISTNQTSKEFSGLYLYGLDYIVYEHNIKVIPENEVCAYLRKLKGDNMRFDVVIGNPPYNNDIYLDFVTAGHELASKFSCWITPAKWQAKGGVKNEAFRRDIVPYMKEIVFYPNESDVFDISMFGGISFFLIDKKIHEEKIIANISKKIDIFNNTAVRKLNNILNNHGFNFINRLHIEKSLQISDMPKEYKYKYIVNKLMSGKGVKRTENSVLCPAIIDTDTVGYGENYLIRFSSDNKEEVESFVSYLNTKFVRYIILLSVNAMFIVSNENFRFVPAPEAFDHIFTDQELYAKYDLTYEEINIIESVIKERK